MKIQYIHEKMRIIKRHSLLKPGTDYVIDSPQPSNISYWWNVGSLLGLSLVIQIITGVTLAMHYNASVIEAFNSVEHIMRDVNNGWLIRYLHSNTASAFFFLVYLHIGRGLYYGSYKAPRSLTWILGTIIFILMMATAFLGYVLPFGQMSLWGATVITNLMSAIPWIGQDIVEFVWGGFSVNNATLNRFFSLHFVLPFILAALVLMHLIALHDSAGSNNPLGVSGNYDRVPFAPYFIFKDIITIFIFTLILSLFVFFVPNVLGDSENYVMANPMQTPPAIVPEWYLLPFYAILRSIPNKLIGVISMFSAILILLAMMFGDMSKLRGIQFKPFNKNIFFLFIGNLLLLLVLGAKHVESPFIEAGQIATLTYFVYFGVIVPLSTNLENIFNRWYIILNNKISKLSINIKFSNWLNIYREIPSPHRTTVLPLSSIIPWSGTHFLNGFRQCMTCMNNDIQRHGVIRGDHWSRAGYRCSNGCGGWIAICHCGDNCRLIPECRNYVNYYGQILASLQINTTASSNNNNNTSGNNNSSSIMLVILTSLIALLLFVIYLYSVEILNFVNDKIISLFIQHSDAPRPWGLYFQDSASPQMEALIELHDNIMFYLIAILFAVGWIITAIIKKYLVSGISSKYVTHGSLVEIIWTFSPGLILIFIAFTSFRLLYLMDEVSDVNMTLYIEGHQWYWSYQYPDFLDSDDEFIEYDSYLTPESDLEGGALRMLDVDERVVIPEITHVRFIVTSGDVIHSYACPALGIKADAYPGRLNQASALINRLGTFYGQCSEICGILHSSMPIAIESVNLEKFLLFLWDK